MNVLWAKKCFRASERQPVLTERRAGEGWCGGWVECESPFLAAQDHGSWHFWKWWAMQGVLGITADCRIKSSSSAGRLCSESAFCALGACLE